MGAAQSDLEAGLKQAIAAERDGHNFYRMAVASTEDPKGKEVFATLAAEELDHMHFLAKHYESILKTGKLDPSAKLGARADLSGMSPIFSDALKGRIGAAHFEMSALSIGVQLELDATKFYKAQADAAADAQVRQFFTELADWEAGHYHALLAQQEELKEDYWSAAGFSAF